MQDSLIRIPLEVTPEMHECIEYARADVSRNEFLENALWENLDIRKAAKKLHLKKPERPKRGPRR